MFFVKLILHEYLGTWKHTSSIFTGFFVRHQYCSNRYVACYAPIATALMTNKNPAQILDAYLFPSALPVTDFAATIQVKANAGGSVVKWKAGFYRGYMNNNPPEALNEAAAISIVKGIFRAGLDNLKQISESNKTTVKVEKKSKPKQKTTRIKKADKNIEVDTKYPASNFQPKVIYP